MIISNDLFFLLAFDNLPAERAELFSRLSTSIKKQSEKKKLNHPTTRLYAHTVGRMRANTANVPYLELVAGSTYSRGSNPEPVPENVGKKIDIFLSVKRQTKMENERMEGEEWKKDWRGSCLGLESVLR